MDENRGYSIVFCPNGDSRDVLRRGENSDVLRRLRNITPYDSAYDLLGNELDTAFMEWMTDDFLDFLRHVDDWSEIGYFCLNGDTVLLVDSVNGDVLAYCTVSALLDDIMEQYRNEIGEECFDS